MLTPNDRLIFWAALLLPALLLAPFTSSALLLFVLLLAILLVVATVDALRARNTLAGMAASVPSVVRLSKDQPGIIPIQILTDSEQEQQIELGISLPNGIISEHYGMIVALPANGKAFVVDWKCIPHVRGAYQIDRCYIRVSSPLLLWKLRGHKDCQSEIRIYPNMLTDRSRLASIFLNKAGPGSHTQRLVGQGRDFEKLRDYIPGDGYDEIHWKATAKKGRPITKIFQAERTQEVYVVIDSSRLSSRMVGEDNLLERYISSALVMGLVAERQGDLFGLMTFDSRVRTFIRASGGKAHFDSCREAIYSATPSIVTPDYDELMTFIRLRLRKRSLLMILTDLSDPMLAESFMRSIDIAQREHVILVHGVTPQGAAPLFSGADMQPADSLYHKLAGHIVWRHIAETRKSLQRKGVHLFTASSDGLCTEMVSQYMSVKSRQAL